MSELAVVCSAGGRSRLGAFGCRRRAAARAGRGRRRAAARRKDDVSRPAGVGSAGGPAASLLVWAAGCGASRQELALTLQRAPGGSVSGHAGA